MQAHTQPAYNRLFSFLLLGALALSSLALSARPGAAATVQTNALIKGEGAAVYYLSDEPKRYVFPNERVFKTWYQDFTGMQTLSASALAGYPIGGNVLYRPGTRMVKIVSDPTVYAVGTNGTLHGIASESAAKTLYGTNWSSRVDDLPDAFFFDYEISSPLDGSEHPSGTLFKYSGQNTYYLLLRDENDGPLQARALSSALLSAWRYDTANALTLTLAAFPYETGTALTADDLTLSYAHQPSSSSPTPSPLPLPTPSPATLTVSAGTGVASSMQAVRNDSGALFYQVNIKGDNVHALTMTSLSATFYIDAGGADTDFGQGSDEDGLILWPVGQIIRDAKLVNAGTGASLDTQPVIDGSGRVTFRTALELAPKSQTVLNIIALVSSAPSNARISVDVTPATDIMASSASASSVTVAPATKLNGGASPSIIVALKPYGKLQIKSSNTLANSLQTLSASYSPMKISFVSTGEPFIVKSFSFTTTTEGSAYLSVKNLSVVYKDSTGTDKITNVNQIENGRFHFINLDIAVPKNGTVDVPITVESDDQPPVFSNSRLQLSFITDRFSARSLYSDIEYALGDFANQQKLVNSTAAGPLIVYREGAMAFTTNAASPQGSVTRFPSTTTLTFNVTGKTREVSIRRLTFKMETNDLNVAGDDNDLFERYANANPFDLARLYIHDADKADRDRIVPTTTTFSIFDKSAVLLDTTPDGLQTGSGDYGLFVLNFGSNPIVLTPGQTLSFDLDIDTSLVSSGNTYTVRTRLLGDIKSASTSEANLLWDDGSNISASGYLLEGLDLSGSTLSIR